MSPDERAQKAIEIIERQLKALDATVKWSRASGDTRVGWERLNSWRNRTIKLVSQNVGAAQGERLKISHSGDLSRGSKGATTPEGETFSERQLLNDLVNQAQEYKRILVPLRQDLEAHPERISDAG